MCVCVCVFYYESINMSDLIITQMTGKERGLTLKKFKIFFNIKMLIYY